MDYLIDGIIIVFVLSCIGFFYNALKIQHGSKNFPTPKEESKDGPLDEIEDEYQRYAEEELEKNTKQMESFKGEDAEVIPEKKKPIYFANRFLFCAFLDKRKPFIFCQLLEEE